MRVLVALSVLVVVVCGAPQVPYYHVVQPAVHVPSNLAWSQYKQVHGPTYRFGYEFPGQGHHEMKDDQNNVKGTFGYVDAHGNPVVWKYISDSNNDFRAQVETAEPQVQPQPVKYTYEQKVENSLSPLMRLAVDTGVVQAAGSSPLGTPQYVVSPHLAEEVGGVSSLAYRLGAVPVAAVHDVQQRPSGLPSQSSFSPVLIHQETPKVTLYTLEVPQQ